MWQVILGRAVTGVGGAGMVTLASVIITGEQYTNQSHSFSSDILAQIWSLKGKSHNGEPM